MQNQKKKNLFLKLFIFREIRSLIFGKLYLVKLIFICLILLYFFPKHDLMFNKANFYYKRFILDGIENNYIIIGDNRVNKIEVENIIKKYGDNIYKIKDNIRNITWVDEVSVRRDLESKKLVVDIEEYEPFAIFEEGKKKFLVDNSGTRIKLYQSEKFENIIFLRGKYAEKNIKSLINIAASNYHFGGGIYSATWIGNRRWDIRLDNNILVKLPERKINNAINKLLEIYQTPGSLIGLEVIDLRVANKIYLQYSEGILPVAY